MALILPLTGIGWVSWSANPETAMGDILKATEDAISSELTEEITPPVSIRELATNTPVLAADLSVPLLLSAPVEMESEPLPRLPVNPLLEDGATPKRYAEWYRGTPTELLCKNMTRLAAIRKWDPKTCPCSNSDPSFHPSKAHALRHELHHKTNLLLEEGNWLAMEIRRQIKADLKDGGSLPVFRMPRTRARMMTALQGSSKEERRVLGHLLMEAQIETRRVAIEAEFVAGRYKVSPNSPWG
jgi:hypothetical protein